jgi:hypothetical protein
MTYPSPILASPNASESGLRPRRGLCRSASAGTTSPLDLPCPASALEGTAMLAALGRKHIA